MVPTSFKFNANGELVQLARRMTTRARGYPGPMSPTERATQATRQRPSDGACDRCSEPMAFMWLGPANFFTPIQRPRGRPPAVTRQLRALAATPRSPRPASRSDSNPRRSPQPRQQPVLAAPRADPSQTVEAPSSTATTQTSPTTEAPSSTEAPQSPEAPSTAETTSTTEAPPHSVTPPSAETPTSTEIPSITEASSTTETPSNLETPPSSKTLRSAEAPPASEYPPRTETPLNPPNAETLQNPSSTEAPPNTEAQPTLYFTRR